MSDGGRLRAEREAKREAFKRADASLKEAKRVVAELEKQLQAAQAALRRNETAHQVAKSAKQAAEKAMMDSLTRMAGDITKTAEEALGARASGEAQTESPASGILGLETVMPEPGARVLLWEGRQFSGRSILIQCCGSTDLAPLLQEAGLRSIRSISVPRGIHAAFQTSASYLESPASSFDLFGDVGELDGVLADYRQSCCSSVRLSAGVQHHEDSSVVLYEEEGFQGPFEAFLEGDHGVPKISQVGSVRVPAGLRVTLRAADAGDSASFGGILGLLKRDTRTFPAVDTSTAGGRSKGPPVRSLSVRRVPEEDMHGLWVYFQPHFGGRPQFFDSGSHYLYPESWPAIQSLRPTNWTSARLFSAVLKSVRGPVPLLDANSSQPHTIEVMARCEPPDFCGAHGKCYQPQRCNCDSPYQGERCHLQVPDETSGIVCERNAVVVGETVSCRLQLRRDSAPCNATSLFLRVDPHADAQEACELFGGPIIKTGGLARYSAQEAEHFDFEAAFNSSGVFEVPFVFSVFNKAVAGMFVPRIEVLPRCDSAGVRGAARCSASARSAGPPFLDCALSLHEGGSERPLRCPAASVRVFLSGGARSSQPLRATTASSGAVLEHLSFSLPLAAGGQGADRRVHLRVEIQHGGSGQTTELYVDVDFTIFAAKEPAHAPGWLSDAHVLLRAGDVAGALERLEACADHQLCLKLKLDLLIQCGRHDEAAEALKGLGAPADGLPKARIAEARRLLAKVEEAVQAGSHEDVVRQATAALEAAPLSAALRLLCAEAALQVGAFDLAIDQARQGHRARRLRAPGPEGGEAVRTLKAMALALLGMGLADAGKQNLRGCVELQGAAGAPHTCEALLSAAVDLSGKAAAMRGAAQREAWAEAEAIGDEILHAHSAQWPAFERSLWALEVDTVRCLARAARHPNATLEELAPCQSVADAGEAMRERIAAASLLGCHGALAEALERNGSLPEALRQAEIAEGLLAGAEEAFQEAQVAEVRLLRERLARAVRRRQPQQPATAGAGQGGNATRREEKPRDHYEVLGLPRNATLPEVKAAYRRLALKYHPDKNPDPAAVPMFLDVQQAYQVLSDENLRRRYDAGQQVDDDEIGAKNMKPMQYRIVEIDRERGIARVWWFDPNTGEEGFMEVEVPPEESEEAAQGSGGPRRTLREHCCLPGPGPGGG